MTVLLRSLLSLALLALAPLAAAQGLAGGNVAASLVAETTSAHAGQELWVALRLEHADDWHTYWKNPGDAGKATEIDWSLPEGVNASEIVWPTPQRFELPADLVDFGYEGEIFLLTALTLPEDFAASSLDIGAEARWLECEEICIPGSASLSLSLPVETPPAEPDPRWAEGFARTRASLPEEGVELSASFAVLEGRIDLLVQATDPIFEDARRVSFIPGEHRVFDYQAEQAIDWQLSSLQLSQAHHARLATNGAPEELSGLLVVEEQGGRQTAYPVLAQSSGVSLAGLEGALPVRTAQTEAPGLFLVFGFALLGGLILNLMPCVFPVLSLKALSLAAGGGQHRRERQLHGLAYTGGVIAAFLTLALVLLSLQAGGAAIGWGFHLQSPWFVAGLIYLFFLMGLSMSGVVEFGAGIMRVGGSLAEAHGYRGSFFTGVLASVVASPCTAPFMGTALGFALTQSIPVALTVFVALGLGMALPFLLLSFVPALARVLPKPGAWMLTFKQILAFPLYATAAWLLWVLGRQTGPDAMALVVLSCVLLGLAAWLYQRRRVGGPVQRWAGALVILLCLAGSLAVLRSPFLQAGAANSAALAQADAESAGYQPYSAELVADLRAAGTPVFVNMTASWCITCLVNERAVLSSAEIAGAMEELGIAYLKGDWTNNDPAITAVLKEFNTSGVPLYLLYPADPSQPAEVLPQLLTEGAVLEAMRRAAKGKEPLASL